MNRGYLYLLLAIVCGGLGLWVDLMIARIFFLWISLSSLYFGAGYLSGYGELLQKRRDGRLPIWVKILLWPIFLGILLYHLWARFKDKAPPMQEIRPGIWLGRRLTVADKTLFQESRVSAVLDVTAEFDSPGSELLPKTVAYFNVPMFDRNKPRLSQLVKCVKWVSKQRAMGREVLVHCALGQGRSVTALLAYFLYEDPGVEIEDLLKEVKRIRSTAAPNAAQMRLLKRFRESEAIHSKRRVRVIHNPVSGVRNSAKDRQMIEEMLGSFLDVEFAETTREVSASSLARKAIADGVEQIVASGGDGTVAEVATEVQGTGIPMGIFPRGTANALSVCLYGAGIRVDPIRICAHHILAGETRAVDVATCGDQMMFLLAGVGVERGMVERADRELKSKYGVFAYLVGGARQIEAQELFKVVLTVDGETHRFESGSVTVANAAPNSSIFAQGGGPPAFDDGQLDVTAIVDVKSKVEALGVMAGLFSGKYARSRDDLKVKHFRGATIRIETNPPQKLVVDGEIAGETPIEFRTIPGALRVFVDPDTTELNAGDKGSD